MRLLVVVDNPDVRWTGRLLGPLQADPLVVDADAVLAIAATRVDSQDCHFTRHLGYKHVSIMFHIGENETLVVFYCRYRQTRMCKLRMLLIRVDGRVANAATALNLSFAEMARESTVVMICTKRSRTLLQ